MYNNVSEVQSVFSERLAQIMDWNGVSNTELAESIGVNALTIKNTIKQISMPEAATICKIADYFAVSVDWLLGRVDECDEIMAKEYFNAARILSYEAYMQRGKDMLRIEAGYFAPWPYNLAEQIVGKDVITGKLSDDQIKGFDHILKCCLDDRSRDMLIRYYKDERVYEEIGAEWHITRERVRQIIAKAVRKLRYPYYANYILNGYEGERKRQEYENKRKQYESLCREVDAAAKCREEELESINDELEKLKQSKFSMVTSQSTNQDFLDIPIVALDLSTRATNCLKRIGCDTVQDIAELIRKNPANVDENEAMESILYRNLLGIRNMGHRSAREVVDRLIDRGFLKAAV